MKQIAHSIAVAAFALSSPAVLAADDHHPAEGKKVAAPAKSAGDRASMQDRMKRMQEQMDRIQKTTDPKERQKLLDEHRQTMMENMKTMRGMGMHGDAKGGPMKGDSAAHAAQMEQRMDMMQMMMEHMMQRESMRSPSK